MKRLVALAIPLLLIAAACGGGDGPDPSSDPKGALISALENMAEAEGTEAILSLSSDAGSLVATSEGSLKEEDAQKILDSAVTLRSKGTGEDADAEIVVTIAGEDDVNLKVVDKVLYVQADVEGLMETFGADTSSLEQTAAQAESAGMGFVRNVIDGEWIAITGLEELQQQMGGGASVEQLTPDQEKLIKDLTAAFEESAEVTHAGSDDAGEHLVVSVPVRSLYTRVRESLGGLGGSVPLGQLPDASEIPEGSIELDVWVADNRVTEMLIDFMKIAETFGEEEIPEGVESLGLLLQFNEFDDDIEVPEDAVEVSGQQLFQMFMGSMGSMGSMGGGSAPAPAASFDCSELEGAPPEVLDQFADVCPGL